MYAPADLEAWVESVLVHFGATPVDASVAAAALIDADLSGVDTHGLYNFPTHWHYAPGLRSGDVTARRAMTTLRSNPSTTAWDAGATFGYIAEHHAVEAVCAMAAETGIGMLTWRNGCHFGAIGHAARMIAARGYVGAVMCNMIPGAVPPGGRDKVFGTNPMAFAAPVPNRHPFAFDIATTATAGTRLVMARERGESIPLGWAVDGEGNPTTDPFEALKGGALPFGSAEGNGYKGFGLGLMVDVLAGVLSGAGSGAFHVYQPGYRQGAWFAAWKVDCFVDQSEYDVEMGRLVDFITSSRPAPGNDVVTIPGDRAEATRQRRLRDGIPLSDVVVERNTVLGRELGIEFPTPV
ncbi:MAG: Ldh family oxidoreductase [Acidimicrobiia bacterium]